METAIVLFTRDLRLHDNPALHAACARARQVVPAFVLDPALGGPPNRIRFLADALADLREQLRDRGADLVIRSGDPAAEVIRLADETGANAVYVADDVSHYATRRRRALDRDCAQRRLNLVVTPGLTVVPPGELRPAGGSHYRVFTPYWRAWRAASWRQHYPVPRAITMPAVTITGALPERGPGVSPELAPGGERIGRRRFTAWRQGRLAGYDEHHDDLAGDDTSRLSAYLRFGCVSPLEVAIGARDREGGEAFCRQLAWRDFFYQVTAAFPDMAQKNYRPGPSWPEDEGALQAWRSGFITRLGRVLLPVPATHCQLPALQATSPSASRDPKCRYPCRQSMPRLRVRNEAVIIRARLCMKPSADSCRIPASTIGMPVCPVRQACSAPSSSGQEGPGR
jgi:deoxyribodipyrimidine photo-lyase